VKGKKTRLPASPIGEAQYERELDRLSAEFQRACERRGSNYDSDSLYSKVRQYLREHEPLTAVEACVGAGVAPAKYLHYGPLFQRLLDGGWVSRYDQIEKTWIGEHGARSTHKVWRFLANERSAAEERSCERAARKFLAAVDKLDARRLVGACLTQRIERPDAWRGGDAERNEAISRRYLEGRTLAEVGMEFGLTRERVRQIVARRAFDEVALDRRRGIPIPPEIRQAIRRLAAGRWLTHFCELSGLKKGAVSQACHVGRMRADLIERLRVALVAYRIPMETESLVQWRGDDSGWHLDGGVIA